MQTSLTLYRIGRFFLALLFVISGTLKIIGFSGMVAYMTKIGMPVASLAVPLSIVVELGGGLALMFGWNVRPVAIVVAAFTVVATLFAHRFWEVDGAAMSNQLNHFFKNVSIIGALLMLAARDPFAKTVKN